MTKAETMEDGGEWPPGARWLRHAVFAQPYAESERKALANSLGAWAVDEAGERKEKRWDFGTGYALTDTRIDFESGEFFYAWESLRKPNLAGETRIYPPWRGFTGAGPSSAKLFGANFDALLEEAAHMTWEGMVLDFERRLELGEVKLFGRRRSPLESVSAIPWDVWRHFAVEHWNLGTAICEATGERLFSLHAIESEVAGGSTGMRRARADDYAEYLREAMHHAQRGLPMTIQETEAWAKTRGLSREFARTARQRLADSAKLRPGEKRADRRASL